MTPFIPPSDSPSPIKSSLYELIITNDDKAITSLASLLVERSGYSQRAIATSMGIDHQTLSNVIRGRTKRPSMWFMAKLAHACGAALKLQWKP